MPYYKTPHATSISGYCWETNNSQTWWPETTIHLFRTGCSWALLLSYMVSVGITDGLWPLLMSAGDWLVPHGLDHMFRVSLSHCDISFPRRPDWAYSQADRIQASKSGSCKCLEALLRRCLMWLPSHHLIRTSYKACPGFKRWEDRSYLFMG